MEKKLFLFDMDGTLTPARGKMHWDMETALTELQRSGWDIGIISGSDLDYIYQQCALLLDMSPFNSSMTHFLPCNGTKYYKNFKKIWEYDMRSKLGSEFMTDLFTTLLKYQGNIIAMYPNNIPLTGNFFQMRGSVLNWCPIGRNALQEDREKWIKLDKKSFVREWFVQDFKETYNSDDITIKLGGETSFDIYPNGWNKTFPLDKEPFSEYEKIYFVGDNCNDDGNDKELYDLLKQRVSCDSFEVSCPDETIKIINKIIGA